MSVTTTPDAPAPAPPGQGSVTPPAARPRVASLDVLRGIAILGTFLTNVTIFTGSSAVVDWSNAYAQSPIWQGFDTFIGLITDGKWMGLLTIMFGVGLEIQRQSAIRRGEPWLGTYPWRAIILFIDGSLNYIFVFEYDALMGYGSTALVLCVLLASNERFHWWILGLAVTAHLAYLSWYSRVWEWFKPTTQALTQQYTAEQLELLNADPTTLTPKQLAEAADLFGMSPKDYLSSWLSGGDDFGYTSYWSHTAERWDIWSGGRPNMYIMISMGLALFMVGAMLYRHGLFDPRGHKLRMWVMGLSFGIGLPLDWGTRLFFGEFTSSFNRYLTSPMVTVGVMALIAHFYVNGRMPGFLGKPLTLIGKMALSNYLLQNVLGMFLFYNYFLALGRFWSPSWPPVLPYVAWLGMSALMVTFSWWWLRRFDRGPVEIVWNWSLRTVQSIVPTRWEPRVRRADAHRAAQAQSTQTREAADFG